MFLHLLLDVWPADSPPARRYACHLTSLFIIDGISNFVNDKFRPAAGFFSVPIPCPTYDVLTYPPDDLIHLSAAADLYSARYCAKMDS